MRIALLTLEALAASAAVRRFVAANAHRIALVGLSDPFRREAGGMLGQTLARLRVSGPGILPYLFVNFSLPRLAGAIRGRGVRATVEATPVAATCGRLGIPCVPVADVNGAAFRETLARSGADLIVSFHVDQILAAETIAAAPLGGVNVHAGRLPDHRGPVPTIHALLDDPVVLGISIHRLAAQIDAGDLLAQAVLPDDPGLSAIGAAARLHEAALPLLDRVLDDIAAGRAPGSVLPTKPYRGFPTPDELRRLRRKGRRTVGWGDVVDAFRHPA